MSGEWYWYDGASTGVNAEECQRRGQTTFPKRDRILSVVASDWAYVHRTMDITTSLEADNNSSTSAGPARRDLSVAQSWVFLRDETLESECSNGDVIADRYSIFLLADDAMFSRRSMSSTIESLFRIEPNC